MDIDRLAKAEHISKSTMARKFMEERLEQYRIEKAIELYVNEKGSLKVTGRGQYIVPHFICQIKGQYIVHSFDMHSV